MRIALYTRIFSEDNKTHLYNILMELQRYCKTVLVHETLMNSFPEITQFHSNIEVFGQPQDLDKEIDFLISLGGDGTLLDTVTYVQNKNIPILGINFGRLGFLAASGKDDIKSTIQSLVNNNFDIDKRSLIHVDADAQLFDHAPFGLNDFTISKKDTSPMIRIKTFLNGEYLNTYWADGLIVSTPTGSTAYNMSCSGPILFPSTESFVITPIAPHHLNTRPIVVPDSHIISFEIESRIEDKFICSLDARRVETPMKTKIAIRKESFYVHIVRLQENSFLSSLKSKLGWGMDKRN